MIVYHLLEQHFYEKNNFKISSWMLFLSTLSLVGSWDSAEWSNGRFRESLKISPKRDNGWKKLEYVSIIGLGDKLNFFGLFNISEK